MDRNGGVIALTVVGVLVAGGAAAALNTVVLDNGNQSSVASAERFLSSGRSPVGPTASASPSASLAPPPVISEDSVAVTAGPTQGVSHPETTGGVSAPRATRTDTRQATVARVSPTRASARPTDTHGDSRSRSDGSHSSSLTPDSDSGGGGSDD